MASQRPHLTAPVEVARNAVTAAQAFQWPLCGHTTDGMTLPRRPDPVKQNPAPLTGGYAQAGGFFLAPPPPAPLERIARLLPRLTAEERVELRQLLDDSGGAV